MREKHCRAGAPVVSPNYPPVRPCRTLTLQSLSDRLDRLEAKQAQTPRLHCKDVMLRYSIGRATLYRWRARGWLPSPVRLGVPLWREADLLEAEKTGRLPEPKPSEVRLK